MRILLTADWHIRGDRPRCRVDEDWLESQRHDIACVRDAADRFSADEVWVLGDMFHQPRCATEAVVMVLDELRKFRQDIAILPGNHDLPFHDYGNIDRCSLGIVLKSFRELHSCAVEEIPGEDIGVCACPFGLDPESPICDVWATHRLVFRDEASRPMKGLGWTAQELLDSAPLVREMIVTGDYHHGYVHVGPDGRRVVTPGCLNIQAADMAGYQPRVYMWDTCNHEVEEIRLNTCHSECVVTDYLAVEKEREDRMEKVLEVIGRDDSVSLSFMDNLEREVAGNGTIGPVYLELRDRMNGDRQ